jgi:hypothetical protein
MILKSGVLAIISCAAFVCGSVYAQEQPPQIGNGDILNMLRANVPESTVLGEIEVLVRHGANFDISPAAVIELQRSGASEKVMNTIVWMQTNVVPGIAVPLPRAVFYRSGANATKLNSFLLWPEFKPRWTAWPFYQTGGKEVTLHASPGVVQVSETTPTLLVQGLDPDAGWQLVKMERGTDYRVVTLKRKHAFDSDFFSDSTFEHRDLRPIAFSPEGERSFTVRPTTPLGPGDYALCGQLPGGAGWMRACYEFQVVGM